MIPSKLEHKHFTDMLHRLS